MPKASIDWPAIRLEYVNGSMTYAELAERHALKAGTVRQRGNREGWEEQRNAVTRHVTQAAQGELTETRIDELREFNSADLKLARAIRENAVRLLEAGATIDEATGEPVPLSPRDLNSIAKAAESAQKVGRLALGVSTDNLGHGGPNGLGPVPVTELPPGEYRDALAAALAAF